MDATYCFEEPRTAILRRTLLGHPGRPGAAADLLFLEAWEAQLADGIAAILRARQIRRANPALAVGSGATWPACGRLCLPQAAVECPTAKQSTGPSPTGAVRKPRHV